MKTITHSASKWLFVLVLAIYTNYASAGQIIYVDINATGANNGSNWADAYKYLKDALVFNDPNYDPQILVAQGTYRPDVNTINPGGTNDRTATFQLKNRVAVYGGFPSGGGIWESRNPNIYETILSGDINVPDNNSDNSYHVVTSSDTDSTAILDGFTITAGNANGPYPEPTIKGGGMYNNNGSPTVNNCTFIHNTADWWGGGIFNSTGNPTLTNCTFTGNFASNGGGGMYNINYSGTLTNCTFIGNSAGGGGGGMCNTHSSPKLTNCTFSGNSAINANSTGGGIYNEITSSPYVTNCTFTGNKAAQGGGIFNNLNTSSPGLFNCTFSENSATQNGGGVFSFSNFIIRNSIFWGNIAPTGTQIYIYGGTVTVGYSDIQGGWAGTGNINAAPLFVDANGSDNTTGTEDDNLRLLPGSPCIDVGYNNFVPLDYADLDGDSNTTELTPLDLDLRPRFTDGDCNSTVIVDMGAYEFTYVYIGDFDFDCEVDFRDFAIQAVFWQADELLVDVAPTPAGDGIVDIYDLSILCDNWLVGK